MNSLKNSGVVALMKAISNWKYCNLQILKLNDNKQSLLIRENVCPTCCWSGPRNSSGSDRLHWRHAAHILRHLRDGAHLWQSLRDLGNGAHLWQPASVVVRHATDI